MFGSIRQLPSNKDTKRKKHGRWQARYTAPDGVRYKAPATFPTKTDAQGWLAAEQRLIDLGTWEPPQIRAAKAHALEEQEALTLGVWTQKWLDRRTDIEDSTRENIQKFITNRLVEPTRPTIQRFATTPINKITRAMAHEWWDAVNEEFDTPPTNFRTYQIIKSAMEAAVQRELIPLNPIDVKAAKRPPAKDKRLPKDEELHAVVNHMPKRYRLVATLCLFMGLRINEALALKRRHLVNLGTEEEPQWAVQVRKTFSRSKNGTYPKGRVLADPKTKAGVRDVPVFVAFNGTVAEHLERFAEGGADSFLTTEADGVPVRDSKITKKMYRANLDAGHPTENWITPHYGRNWLITRLAEQGATPQEIGRVLGQKDLKTITEIYMKVREERVGSVMALVGSSIGGADVVDLGEARRAKDKQAKAQKEGKQA